MCVCTEQGGHGERESGGGKETHRHCLLCLAATLAILAFGYLEYIGFSFKNLDLTGGKGGTILDVTAKLFFKIFFEFGYLFQSFRPRPGVYKTSRHCGLLIPTTMSL